jgi:hypothetical protein
MKKRFRREDDRMISGKLRTKVAREGATHRTVTVDGTEYAWDYRHGWMVWGKGIEAISISVSLHPARTRELILDFALPVDIKAGPPAEGRVRQALQDGIRQAREAGWDPESRGRAFRYELLEEG